MKGLKNIALVLLGLFYLTTACAVTVAVITEGIPSSGAKAIVADTGATKEIPPKRIEPRRHMPMVKQISVPLAIVRTVEFPLLLNEWETVADSPALPNHSHNEHSPNGNRAPPSV
jgi:hypothetical protein